MKQFIAIILVFFATSLNAVEQRLLLTGITLHETSHNQFGNRYNAFNAGAGYEYNRFKEYNEWYFHTNAMLLNDSFRNPQFIVGFGHAMRFHHEHADTAVGLAGFVGVKKLYDRDDTVGTTGSYGLMGGVAPSLSIYRGDFSLNLIYVPSIEIQDHDITGFLFGYFGWKF
jgi:hypothetical protein